MFREGKSARKLPVAGSNLLTLAYTVGEADFPLYLNETVNNLGTLNISHS